VKYIKGKWRVYTINFKKPASAAGAPSQDTGADDTEGDGFLE
jgi:hypothetical protein